MTKIQGIIDGIRAIRGEYQIQGKKNNGAVTPSAMGPCHRYRLHWMRECSGKFRELINR